MYLTHIFLRANCKIGTFYVSFTVGYALTFILEIVATTFLRLGVFMIWEPSIFSLTPQVPSIILPWVLREKQYRPKRITLFAADFATSCVACPIIEEYLKLKTVQWTCKLPRNFKPNKTVPKGKKRSKKNALQPIVRRPDAPEVVNINCYVSQMMASSLGLKLFDTFRRVLMYTKKGDDYKKFYAVCRGLFPIHELCGTMTALMLARRDILGVKMPLWRILGPAVFIHGMANFRGMKVSASTCHIIICRYISVILLTFYLFLINSRYSSGILQLRGPRCSCILGKLGTV